MGGISYVNLDRKIYITRTTIPNQNWKMPHSRSLSVKALGALASHQGCVIFHKCRLLQEQLFTVTRAWLGWISAEDLVKQGGMASVDIVLVCMEKGVSNMYFEARISVPKRHTGFFLWMVCDCGVFQLLAIMVQRHIISYIKIYIIWLFSYAYCG